MHSRIGFARRADRHTRGCQPALWTHRHLKPRQRITSARLERGRAPRRGHLRSSLGHARQGAHAEILAAMARGYAGRNLACDLLDDFWRRLRTLPQAAPAFAHGGGAFPFTFGRIEHAFHVRPDLVATDNNTNPRKYLARKNEKGDVTPARFYVDSLVHDGDALRMLLKVFGAQRVALGSDYPFPLGEERAGTLIVSIEDLSAKERTQLLSGTAREFLGL